MSLFKFTDQEKKTRKHWLISTFILLLGLPFFWLFIAFLFNGNSDITQTCVADCIVGIFGFWLISHCAYKKHGNGLLTWWLVGTPLRFLSELGKSFDKIDAFSVTLWFVIDLPFIIWWYKTSLELRKLNKKIEPSIKDMKKYLDVIYSLRKAANLKALNSIYKSLKEKWPHLEETSLEEYKIIKTSLVEKKSKKNISIKSVDSKNSFIKIVDLLKNMAKDSNNLKRGINRAGIILSFALSIFVFVLGIITIFICGISVDDFWVVLFLFPITLIIFAIPIALAKAIGWIVEGFQKG